MEATNQLNSLLPGHGEGPQRPELWQEVEETHLHPPPEWGGADSDGYSAVSEAPDGWRRRRRHRNEKHLTPACLDMPFFKSTDPNADVTYTQWRFDMQGWLDQYDEASMIPHIFSNLQGYPGKWAHLLLRVGNISMSDLLAHMDHTFGNICDCDTMIRCL